MKKSVYSIYKNCIVVLGYKYSLLCDLFRMRYKRIPTELAHILLSKQNILIEKIKFDENNDTESFLNFLTTLEAEDYIFFHKNKISYKWISFQDKFETHAYFSSSILYVENFTNYNIKNTIYKLSNLGCEIVVFIIRKDVNIEEFIRVLNESVFRSMISAVEIYYFNEMIISEELVSRLIENRRITRIFCEKIVNEEKICEIPLINFYSNLLEDTNKSLTHFFVNPLLYSESLRYNTYFNKKLIINYDGEIIYNWV